MILSWDATEPTGRYGSPSGRNCIRPAPLTSGPIPKFVSSCGTLVYELRNLRTTSHTVILVPFEPEVRDRICRTMGVNFGFGALVVRFRSSYHLDAPIRRSSCHHP